MNDLFQIGDIINDFCNGYFGRDDYDKKICVFVNQKFAVFQYIYGDYEEFAEFCSRNDYKFFENGKMFNY